MNSLQENAKPLPDQSPRQMVEEAMNALILENIQLRRTLWSCVKEAGGKVQINEASVHPLWILRKSRPMPTILMLEADQLPEPTEEQLDSIADKMKGSRMEIRDASADGPLKDINPAYLRALLHHRIQQDDEGFWMPVTQPPTTNAT